MGCIYSGKYLSGICLVGEVSVGDVPGQGSVRRGCVWSGKCSLGICLVGEMSVGEGSIGKESVEEMSVGDVSANPYFNPFKHFYFSILKHKSCFEKFGLFIVSA